MSTSRTAEQYRPLLVFGLTMALTSSPALGGDMSLRVEEATVNELLDEFEPLSQDGFYNFSLDLGLFGRIGICASTWKATIDEITADLQPTGMEIRGDGSVNWCNVSFGVQLKATGVPTYQASNHTIRFSVGGGRVQPYFDLLMWRVYLPVSIDLATGITIPPIPIRPFLVEFEIGTRQHSMLLVPTETQLIRGSGFLELESDFTLR